MATSRSHRRSRRGRPKGPERVGVLVRLLPEQKRDLGVLREILEGNPPMNGLVQEAVRQYIARKLEDPQIRAEFDRRAQPTLQVMSSRLAHPAERV